MRSKFLLFLAISTVPSAHSFYDVGNNGCIWSTSKYICVSAQFICYNYLPYPELNSLNVTAYQIISHYEYVKLSFVRTHIKSDFTIAIPRVQEGDVILSIDVNYCAQYFRQVDHNITAALKGHYEFLWKPLKIGNIAMEKLALDDYPSTLFDQILVDERFNSTEMPNGTFYDTDMAWRKVQENFKFNPKLDTVI